MPTGLNYSNKSLNTYQARLLFMKTVMCRRLGEKDRRCETRHHTQQTLEATRGSAPRPSIRHCRRGARYTSLMAASGSRSQMRPSVQAVVSLTTTLGSFISSMRVGMACGDTQGHTHTQRDTERHTRPALALTWMTSGLSWLSSGPSRMEPKAMTEASR